MPAMVPSLPTKGEINRCGAYLAEGHRLMERATDSETDYQEWRDWNDPGKVSASRLVVSNFRSAHQRPLGIVSEGLRKIVRGELKQDPLVSQRLKRLPRIIRKLARMEQTNLARLEDIGGCRAVLATSRDLEAVRAHLEKTWDSTIVRRRDYVHSPNEMGYRAYHFVVEKNDRRIEVQLRTRGQQTWANAIEAADSRLQLTLKDGIGPASMLRYFSAVGAMFYHQEYGVPVPVELREEYEVAVNTVIEEGYYSRRAS